jgi:hypothetical protein
MLTRALDLRLGGGGAVTVTVVRCHVIAKLPATLYIRVSFGDWIVYVTVNDIIFRRRRTTCGRNFESDWNIRSLDPGE